jgi:integrase/recombinase XerD
MYARTCNSYLSWLHAEGHLAAPLRVKLLRAPHHQKTLLTSADIRLLMHCRLQTLTERRTWTVILLMLDTGIRVSEALGIERARVDLDGSVLTVMGKGRKERVVPFSLEMRKALYRWMTASPAQDLLFTSRSGLPLSYRNVFREVQRFAKRIGLTTPVHPHLLRHCFAASYIRRGGDIYRLSRLLGHTSINTTQIYLRSMGLEDLRMGHERLTPLHLG